MPTLHALHKAKNIDRVKGAAPLHVLCLALAFVLFSVLNSSPAYAQAQPQAPTPKRVLVVCSYGYGLHGYDKALPAIRSVFESSGYKTSYFFVEFMDMLRSEDKDMTQHLAVFFRDKYSTTKFDLIATIQLPALHFFLNEGKELWPDAPILAMAVPDPSAMENAAGRRVVIQTLGPDVEGTLELALKMFPGTKRVVYVNGVGEEEKRAQRVAESAFSRWRDRLEFESTSDLTIDETVQLMSRLPRDTIVIYLALLVDKTGRTIMPDDIVKLLSRAAGVPIFAVYDTVLGAGALGGSMVNASMEGTRTGRLAVDILQGNLVPTDQITVLSTGKMPMFDWEQLEKWRVDKSMLPDGSIIVNRPHSVWIEYRWYMAGLLVVLLVQSLLITGLLVHKRHRRSAEELLKNTEERYRNIFESALEGIYETSPEGKGLIANPAMARMLGYDSPEEIVSSTTDSGHQLWTDPNDRLNYVRQLESNNVVLNYECQLYRKDKTKIWASLNARRVLGPDGQTLCYSGFVADVSERKRVENALAESRAHILALINCTDDLIWSVDPVNFGVITWNRALEGYFLKDRGIELCVGMTPQQLVPPDYVTVWNGFYLRALREGSFVTEYTVATGKIILLLSFHLLEHNGDVFGISIFGKDITQRKLFEDELRKSEERYRALVETTSDCIWEVDANGRFTYAAPKIKELLGYAPEEVIGLTPFELMPEIDARWFGELFAQIAAAKRPFSGLVNVPLHRDGREVVTETSGVPMFGPGGEFTGFCGMSRDITERSRAEAKVRESEERYRALVETSSDWVWEIDANATYTFAAPRVQEILGYSPEEVLGRSPFEFMPEIEARRVKAIFADIAAERRPFSRLVNANQHRNGRLVILESNATPIIGPAGEFRGYRGMDRDITDRMMAEQELLRYREHLEELIEERTAELVVEKERAEAADHVKSVFLATMSHELRTPLNSIIGFTGLLQQELTGPLNEEQKKQLGMVRASGAHLLNLINDVLDISKIEAGQLEVAVEPFDLRALIEKVVLATKPLAEKKCIALEVDIASGVNSISSDRRRVEQILLNLLSNAVKFTEEGKIHVSCSLRDGEVSVCVEDTGIGIRNRDMDLLFTPFQQIQTGAARHFEGTGLGLSICKKLLDLLGGGIEVCSEWGKGSAFSFTLPVERLKE
jgi:PAS domain S-box-containing protein